MTENTGSQKRKRGMEEEYGNKRIKEKENSGMNLNSDEEMSAGAGEQPCRGL